MSSSLSLVCYITRKARVSMRDDKLQVHISLVNRYLSLCIGALSKYVFQAAIVDPTQINQDEPEKFINFSIIYFVYYSFEEMNSESPSSEFGHPC